MHLPLCEKFSVLLLWVVVGCCWCVVSGPTKSSGESILASVGVPLLLAALFITLFVVRSMAPRGMMKIGISMLQIVATANSVYTIPWPPAFSSFLDLLKIFLVSGGRWRRCVC